jgi:hypothetical protein
MRKILNLKHTFFTILILVLLSLSVSAQKVYEWDLPTAWAPDNYQSKCLKIFADEVYARTD